jgi:hypothetical protein
MFKILYLFTFGLILIFLGFLVYGAYKAHAERLKDENLIKVEQGMMSVVTYKDHSYIVWSINFGGGIYHNPDCKCKNKVVCDRGKE